jgi:hypothetical protein
MAIPTYPGVYVEEISSGVRPITAASTSTPAFIGEAEKGSLTEAVKIYNFTQFQNLYGGFLTNSYLAHAVYQFFNNGGAQCYIVRVAGANVCTVTSTASIGLSDRGTTAQLSLTINAVSPGSWGNSIEVVVSDGTRDPGNEFNLKVFYEGEPTPRESYDNLSMVAGAPNFVETATSNSKSIRVTVNQGNTNATAGISRGAGTPTVPLSDDRRRLRINIHNDGYQEINLQDAVGSGDGQVANLDTAENVRTAIQYVVSRLTRQRDSTPTAAFSNFTCTLDAGVLVLTAGATGIASSVNVAPAASSAQDATGLLNLGRLRSGVETLGGAVVRPTNNSSAVPRYLVGDQATPATGVVTGSVVAGSDGDPVVEDQPFINAFQRLNNIDDVSLLAVPGRGSNLLVGEGMNYCANRSLSDCFFIGDMAPDDDTVPELQTFVNGISPKNSYGAVYAPWLLMLDPTGVSQEPIAVPPSGFVAGMYAKTDTQRGVWKAPAGTAAALAGATGLVVNFTDVEQGNLNPDPYHVNLIRQFPAAGRIIWGARTITSDAEWRYIPVRRMAIFLRVSIYNGIQWAVFEPNDESLWSQLRLNIKSFMMTLFRRGAFQGSTPSQAFFVKCDSETTTQDDIDQGIVNVLVGFAPLKPAEFVVVKISQKAGQSS